MLVRPGRAEIAADVLFRPLQYYTTHAREIKPEAGFFLNKNYEKRCKACGWGWKMASIGG